MRGLKERIEIQTNSGQTWQWRRVCFTMKGDALYGTAATNLQWSTQTNQGMVRTVNNISGSSASATLASLIFRGVQRVDWNNFITAPLDRSRVSVKYDQVRSIASGNATGLLRRYQMWHPMNANLQFDDDEDADGEDLATYSVDSKLGMGDYYVVDIFVSAYGSTSTDQLVFGPSATLYWHEK